jgi:AraC-like DNA-binding protein
MTHIVALIATDGAHREIRNALRAHSDLDFCKSSRGVVAKLATRTVEAVLVETTPTPPLDRVGLVKLIRRRFPTVPVIMVTRMSPEDVRRLIEFGRAGATTVVILGLDDFWEVVRHCFYDAKTVESIVLKELSRVVPDSLNELATVFVRNVRQGWGVTGLAIAMGQSTKTVERRFKAGSINSPSQALAWLRVTIAAYYLEHTEMTTDDIRHRVGIGSAATLRRHVRALTGGGLASARQVGVFREALARLRLEWRGR